MALELIIKKGVQDLLFAVSMNVIEWGMYQTP